MSTPPTIVLENNFGEETTNYIIGGTNTVATAPIADGTILGNFSGGSALPAAETIQAVANKLPAKAGVASINALATADAPTQTASYVQADVQAIATLANDLKAKLNAVLAALKVQS